MKRAILFTQLFVIAAFFALDCGGAQEESRTEKLLEDMDSDVDLVADLTGVDENTPVDVEDEKAAEQPTGPVSEEPAEAAGDAIEGSDGAFVGTLKVNGETVPGTLTVKTANVNAEIIEKDVDAGSEIRLPPGLYDFVFTTDKVVGSPEYTLRDVEIEGGRRITREVKIPVGQITLTTGAKCAKKPIRIRPQGATEWYKGKYQTCVPLTLKAGNYDAEIIAGKRNTTPISGIQVYDGGVRDILIRKVN